MVDKIKQEGYVVFTGSTAESFPPITVKMYYIYIYFIPYLFN